MEASDVAASPIAAKQFANLARMYRLWGRYSEAEGLLKRAIAMERELHPEAPDATPANLRYIENLAGLFAQQGRVAESEAWMKRAENGRVAMKKSITAAVATAAREERRKVEKKEGGGVLILDSGANTTTKRRVLPSSLPSSSKRPVAQPDRSKFQLTGAATTLKKRIIQVKPRRTTTTVKTGSKSNTARKKRAVVKIKGKETTPAGGGTQAARAQAKSREKKKNVQSVGKDIADAKKRSDDRKAEAEERLKIARQAAIKRVRHLKRLELKKKKMMHSEEKEREAKEDEREKQLEELRSKAAARVRARERKQDAERDRKQVLERERLERLANLQQWLEKKKGEQMKKQTKKVVKKNTKQKEAEALLRKREVEQRKIAEDARMKAKVRLAATKAKEEESIKKRLEEVRIQQKQLLEHQNKLQQQRRERIRIEKVNELREAEEERRAKQNERMKRARRGRGRGRGRGGGGLNSKSSSRPQSAQPRIRGNKATASRNVLDAAIAYAAKTGENKMYININNQSNQVQHQALNNAALRGRSGVVPRYQEKKRNRRADNEFDLTRAVGRNRRKAGWTGNRQNQQNRRNIRRNDTNRIKTRARPASAVPSRRVNFTTRDSRKGMMQTNVTLDPDTMKLPTGGKRAQDVDTSQLRRVVSHPKYDGSSSLSFYKLGRLLGEGNFGKVLLAQHKLSGRRVAMKFYDKRKYIKDKAMMRQLRREMSLMCRLNHRNVCKLFETFETQRRAYLVMEFCEGGNLIEHMRKEYPGSSMPEKRAQRLFAPLFSAVKHLHDLNIVHRDIKLDNVLLDNSRECLKLTDFGFSIKLTDREQHRLKLFCGTPAYMAPEIIRGHSYRGLPVDIWALGVVLFAAVAGRFPFMANREKALYKKITAGRFQNPKNCSKSLETLLRGIINVGTRERYTVDHCMQHPWVVQGLSAEKEYRKKSGQSEIAPFNVSNDPADDFREDALRTVESFGFCRRKLEETLRSKKRDQISTSYYLVLGKIRHLPLQVKLLESANAACEAIKKANQMEDEKIENPRAMSYSKLTKKRVNRPTSAVTKNRLDIPPEGLFINKKRAIPGKPFSPVRHQKKADGRNKGALTGYYAALEAKRIEEEDLAAKIAAEDAGAQLQKLCWTKKPLDKYIEEYNDRAKCPGKNIKKANDMMISYLYLEGELRSQDCCRINGFGEAALLKVMRRHLIEKLSIYTYVGDILLCLNPYMYLPEMVDIAEYPNQKHYVLGGEPNSYASAHFAYHGQLSPSPGQSHHNQSCIVSGESGAGKTVACGFIMRYLVKLSDWQKMKLGESVNENSKTDITSLVAGVSLFLEAFGNAKTRMNDNSSRFGKFTKIWFLNGKIVGAKLEHYLLEKARLCGQGEGERNYHIFYFLICGAKEKKDLHLEPCENYSLLKQGGSTEVGHGHGPEYDSGRMNAALHDDPDDTGVRAALTAANVYEKTQNEIWTIIAGCLAMLRVEFDSVGTDKSKVKDGAYATIVAKMLGMPEADFGKMLCIYCLILPGNNFTDKVCMPKGAEDNRNALAKDIYNNLFRYLIEDICNNVLEPKGEKDAFVGLLDIFGFEVMQKNSIEQLCINFANEKLQQLCNRHVFDEESKVYCSEGLDDSIIPPH
eukprot:g2696.t1